MDEFERALIVATQRGLPLVPRPYAALAGQLGCSEREVIEGLRNMLLSGRIRRIGAVPNHYAIVEGNEEQHQPQGQQPQVFSGKQQPPLHQCDQHNGAKKDRPHLVPLFRGNNGRHHEGKRHQNGR